MQYTRAREIKTTTEHTEFEILKPKHSQHLHHVMTSHPIYCRANQE